MAGVSRSTVSRVLNDEGHVRAEVRERVQDVISRTGYTPNVAARSLVSNRTGVIGLVIPSRVHNLFEDPYFARLIQGVTAAANESHATLSLFLFQTEDEERELFPRVVQSGFVDGVIITATRMGDPVLARIAASELPVVMVGRPDLDGVSSVDVDNRGGAQLAARHLIEQGYQRIGMIAPPANTTAGVDRAEAFVAELAAHGRALRAELRADGEFSEASGYDAMRQLAGLGDRRPDAVFVGSDSMAAGALRALRELELRVPDDVAVVGFDGLAASEQTNPPLTTIRQPVGTTAARAVHLLDDLIRGTATPPVSEVIPVELVVRASSVRDRPDRPRRTP
ncbi:MAG: LacI family DNA-binding transcriptional regulator [Ilumatobacter sp.]|nr:LacI family DNA-binding transcriptional regulator [Ilumatobacter sp.]